MGEPFPREEKGCAMTQGKVQRHEVAWQVRGGSSGTAMEHPTRA